MSSTTITVINPIEGRRFRMNLKGDISRLSIRKLKKYLVPSSNIEEEDQILKYHGVDLGDDVLAGEVGISDGATLTIERRENPGMPFIASPNRQLLELETLDQQRSLLLTERLRRDEEFRRQQEGISISLAEAERRRLDLEREQQERAYELKRLKDLEDQAERERQRVILVRNAEAEREAMRSKDLEARRNQLFAERNMQRQLEMQKLENERKKMLLAHQQAELEGEKTRLEREQREYYERRRQHELELREKEFELEKQHVESERARQELEIERAYLSGQKSAEMNQLAKQGRSVEATLALPAMPQRPMDASASGYVNTDRGASQTQFRQPSVGNRLSGPDPQAAVQAQSFLPAPSSSDPRNAQALMQKNLDGLARLLNLGRLTLDDNNTCVVNYNNQFTLLVTFDQATERLFLYSTLTTSIPKDPTQKLRLFEFLLEGALLGRDMCGGGVGASFKNDFILLSTSIYLPESTSEALAAITPGFADCLLKWRSRVSELGIVEVDEESAASRSSQQQSVSVPYRSISNANDTPYLGVEVSEGQVVDGLHHRYYNGVSVVSCKGPAQRAGLLPQDFIKAVAGTQITSLDDFRALVRGLKPHSTVPFVIDRAGAEFTIHVLIGSQNDSVSKE